MGDFVSDPLLHVPYCQDSFVGTTACCPSRSFPKHISFFHTKVWIPAKHNFLLPVCGTELRGAVALNTSLSIDNIARKVSAVMGVKVMPIVSDSLYILRQNKKALICRW